MYNTIRESRIGWCSRDNDPPAKITVRRAGLKAVKYFQYWTYVPTSCLRADTIGTPNRTQERRGTSEERDRSGAKIGLNSV